MFASFLSPDASASWLRFLRGRCGGRLRRKERAPPSSSSLRRRSKRHALPSSVRFYAAHPAEYSLLAAGTASLSLRLNAAPVSPSLAWRSRRGVVRTQSPPGFSPLNSTSAKPSTPLSLLSRRSSLTPLRVGSARRLRAIHRLCRGQIVCPILLRPAQNALLSRRAYTNCPLSCSGCRDLTCRALAWGASLRLPPSSGVLLSTAPDVSALRSTELKKLLRSAPLSDVLRSPACRCSGAKPRWMPSKRLAFFLLSTFNYQILIKGVKGNIPIPPLLPFIGKHVLKSPPPSYRAWAAH